MGMHITQAVDGHITVNFEHYAKGLECPLEENCGAAALKGDIFDASGQTEYKSMVTKLNTTSYQYRPNIVFDAKVMNLRVARKKLKLQIVETKMVFPYMGDLLGDLVMVGLGDAGVKSMPDRVTSVGRGECSLALPTG